MIIKYVSCGGGEQGGSGIVMDWFTPGGYWADLSVAL